MGAYKAYKKEGERIVAKNAGVDYAVLEAGLNVVKAAKRADGSIDFESLAKKPEDYTNLFTQSMQGYIRSLLEVGDSEWKSLPEKAKSLWMKGLGMTPKLIRYMVGGVIARNELLKLGKVLQSDRNFESYRESQTAELEEAGEILRKGYQKNRIGTVSEALEELRLKGIVDPRAVSLQDFPLLEELSRQPSDRLEEIIRKTEPRLLRSSYKP